MGASTEASKVYKETVKKYSHQELSGRTDKDGNAIYNTVDGLAYNYSGDQGHVSNHISDTLGGFTGNQFKGAYGHDDDYWTGFFGNHSDREYSEYFAQRFSQEMTDNCMEGYAWDGQAYVEDDSVPSPREYTEGMTPNANETFEKIISEYDG